MTKKDLVKIIREVVKREVKSLVKQELNEALTEMEQGSKPTLKERKKYTSNSSLNNILNETANSGDFDEWPEVSTDTLRSRFAGMQNTAAPQTDINNRPIDTNKLGPALNKALTRDYSELVKRFK